MSDTNRMVTGLVRANREPGPASPTVTPAAQPLSEPPTKPRTSTPKPRPARRPVPVPEGKTQVTVNVPVSIRDESRAAFLATRNDEGFTSYSDFVARAVADTLARLRSAYNNGAPFAGGDQQLPPGRPFQS